MVVAAQARDGRALDRYDFMRMVQALADVVDERPLGPTLTLQDSNPPTWPADQRSPSRHARGGQDCDTNSLAGRTKKVWNGGGGIELEVDRCGGQPLVTDGVPDKSWSDINRAFDDPTWCGTEPSPPDPRDAQARRSES